MSSWARSRSPTELAGPHAGPMLALMPASLDGLDRAQRAAVTHRGGPLLILGGPGTGKTHVLAHRAAWLVEEGTPAASVLVLAPTAAAASDLRVRLETLIDSPYDELS